uniref:Rho GTPase activating protein 4 (Predicted) n=1 Tax=Dasypus novemcinctus TaxID=9361 RepID=C3PSZ1_DASNO|nr:Rho GTPase activating protein 4 (predicted) [Dasypus novemcinctus]
MGRVAAADAAAEPGERRPQRGAGWAPGPAPEPHCRGRGAASQEGQEDLPGVPHGERERRDQAPGSREAGGEAGGPERSRRRRPRRRAPAQGLHQEGRAAGGEAPGQIPGAQTQVHEGAERVPAQPGQRQRRRQQLLPAGRLGPHGREQDAQGHRAGPAGAGGVGRRGGARRLPGQPLHRVPQVHRLGPGCPAAWPQAGPAPGHGDLLHHEAAGVLEWTQHPGQAAGQAHEPAGGHTARAQYTQRRLQRSRQPRPSSQYNQKLFGGDMEKFIQSSGQPVPLVVESCIRFINLHGLQHEGIFRVSGAQLRVSEMRDAFERGEDPLVGGCSAHDLDSVAGVLKLYFRSLEPPLFPPDLFAELLASTELEAGPERAEQVSRLLARLPGPVLVVLRYLFTFLNHLAQYSDENMMDPYNLAVCFGPTLLPVPAGQDPVALQGRVNQLAQVLIVQPAQVFPPPAQLPGPIYEKCMAPPADDCLGDAQLESAAGDNEPELEAGVPAQEDDLDGVVEAVACFSYTGRTAQELTFQRGDLLRLHARASDDWWRGEHAGTRGLIPHKYITLPAG